VYDVYDTKKGTLRAMKVLSSFGPYRYVIKGILPNGTEDCIIQKFNEMTKRFITMYECVDVIQLMTAIEDPEYTKWLDSDNIPCYRENRGDVVRSPYSK